MKQSILVTGAYGGMGRATTLALRDKGFHVFALDKCVVAPEDDITPIQADLTDEQSIQTAYNLVCQHTDKLYAVVHFAGIYMLNSLVEMDSADFDRIVNINLTGAFLVNKHFLPLLADNSRIVITTSELAPLDPLPFTGIYAVTKAALDKYAYSLRMELQLKGIKVSVLRAGAVTTDMLGASTTALDNFVNNTQLYTCNATRFKQIVDSVEARSIAPSKVAQKVIGILGKRKPRFAYAINRNPLLLLLNALPKSFQCWVIKQILKK